MANPDTLQRRTLALLQRRDRMRELRLTLAWVFGIPLSFLGPLVLASIFWLVIGRLTEHWYPWSWYVAALSIVAIPLLFRLESRTGGKYADQAVADMPPPCDGMGRITLGAYAGFGAPVGGLLAWGANPRAASAGFIEFFLVGPRLILGAARQARLERAFRALDRRRAAHVLAQLFETGHALPPGALLRPGESMDDLRPVLIWLAHLGWIGVAEKLDQVYLYTESRVALREFGSGNSEFRSADMGAGERS